MKTPLRLLVGVSCAATLGAVDSKSPSKAIAGFGDLQNLNAQLLNERELLRLTSEAGATTPATLDELSSAITTPKRVPADFAAPEWANKPVKLVVGNATVDQAGRVLIATKDGGMVALPLATPSPGGQMPSAKDREALEKEIQAAKQVFAIYTENGENRLLLKLGNPSASYEIPSPPSTPAPVVGPKPAPQPQPQPQVQPKTEPDPKSSGDPKKGQVADPVK